MPLPAALRAYLLPDGFPESVSSDYVEYQTWDTLQGLMAYLKGVVTTLALMRSLGVGRSGASAESALFLWIARDSVGCAAGLAAGHPALTKRFADRTRVRRWRMFSEFVKGVAGWVELRAPTADRVLPCMCAAAALSAVAGVAGSCARSSLVTHFARRGNLADCSAKEGNQDRAVKLVGIGAAFAYLSRVGDSPRAAWAAYALLTALHLVFNYLAMRTLRLDDAKTS